MANRKHTFIKSIVITLGLGLATLATPAQAYVWQTPYGQLMSNTCIGNDGTFMNFGYQAGPVGAPCQFYFTVCPVCILGTLAKPDYNEDSTSRLDKPNVVIRGKQ